MNWKSMLAVLACLIVQPALRAQVKATTGQEELVRQLLDDFWPRNLQNRSGAEALFEAQPTPPAPVRWAYALNRIHHRKYSETKPLVDQLFNEAATDPDVFVAKIWLASFTGEFNQALMALDGLDRVLDAAPMEANRRSELFEQLGRLVGFMQGPANDRVDALELKRAIGELQQGASADDFAHFEQGRKFVISEFDRLNAELAAELDRQRAIAEMNRKAQRDQVAQQMKEIKTQIDQVRADREQIDVDGRKRIGDLERQTDQLNREFGSLNAQIVALQADVASLWNTVANLNNAIRQQRDPAIRNQLIWQANYYSRMAREREAWLGMVQVNANSVYNQQAITQGQLSRTRGQQMSRLAQVDDQLSELEKANRRASQKLIELQGPPKVDNGRISGLESALQALSTYAPFPVEQQKQRLLAEIR